jgi:hypothetical protein
VRRRIRDILAAISLLFALAAAGLWVRSEFCTDSVVFPRGTDTQVSLWSIRGDLSLQWVFDYPRPEELATTWHFGRPLPARGAQPPASSFLGFQHSTSREFYIFLPKGYIPPKDISGGWAPQGSSQLVALPAETIVIPIWSLVLPNMVLPTLWVYLWRRDRKRNRAGFCAVCGYDLRGTPGRCPECGTAVVKPDQRIMPSS